MKNLRIHSTLEVLYCAILVPVIITYFISKCYFYDEMYRETLLKICSPKIVFQEERYPEPYNSNSKDLRFHSLSIWGPLFNN